MSARHFVLAAFSLVVAAVSPASAQTGLHRGRTYGGFLDDVTGCSLGKIQFIGCTISAYADLASSAPTARNAEGVTLKAAPPASKGPAQFIDCTISSRATVNADKSYGVVASAADAGAWFNGKIGSVDEDERQAEQFDILNSAAPSFGVRVSGTRFSKWKNVIGAAEAPLPIVQRTINIAAPSDTAILLATPLNTTEQVLQSGFNNPDVYRGLSVKGNDASMTQNVIIIGTDAAGSAITEIIQLNGTSTVRGFKPFKTITKIILPARTAVNQTVSVGVTSKLGLTVPISATGDVQQQGRKATAANSYTLEAVSAVDVTYTTVDVGTINASDSFEWSIRASK